MEALFRGFVGRNAGARMRFQQSSIYTCINCPNRLFVGITSRVAGGPGGAKIGVGTSGVGGAGMGLSVSDVALRLSKGGVEVFALEEVELLERVDLLEQLADCLEPSTASFLATLWVTAPHKRAWQ